MQASGGGGDEDAAPCTPAYGVPPSVTPLPGGGWFIRFAGQPGLSYRLQRAPSLSGPWSTSAPVTAPVSGLIEFWDLFPPPQQAFYRTVQP